MEKNEFRIIFMGTPEFAVGSLQRLVEGGYNVVAVVTQPDKPVGRHGSVLRAPAVKVLVGMVCQKENSLYVFMVLSDSDYIAHHCLIFRIYSPDNTIHKGKSVCLPVIRALRVTVL